jgi:hypothetical protein
MLLLVAFNTQQLNVRCLIVVAISIFVMTMLGSIPVASLTHHLFNGSSSLHGRQAVASSS